MEFKGNIILSGKIRCETGLHIGGNIESFEIGGIDSPVIRDLKHKYPYIPGSSLKGKMRFLLEWEKGKIDQNNGDPHNCSIKQTEGIEEATVKARKCPICRVFGISASERLKVGPTRLIVRDAHPTEKTVKMWKDLDTGLLYTEWKKENKIDRITSAATPRDIERVPKGSEFKFEMVYSIYDMGDGGNGDLDFFENVELAMSLLEDSALGGSGSRGYGKISFQKVEKKVKNKEDYRENRERREGKEITKIKEAKEHLGLGK